MLQFSINFIFYVLKGCGSGFWHVMLLSEECIIWRRSLRRERH